MNRLTANIIMIVFIFSFLSCNKSQIETKIEKDYTNLLESIAPAKYYTKDILVQEFDKIYGTWQVIGTSGGFAANGYKADFDYLVLKPNLIFGIIRNDSLITSGKIEIKTQTDSELLVNFISDTDPLKVKIQMVQDPEKYVLIHGDTLDLNAPCCDRFNTHFKKIQ